LAAAWLIDKAGLKGTSLDGVGVHSEQALVIVNPGRRPGKQVLDFADSIKTAVYDMFGVRLVIEPQVYP
jgi:UDP-N-acetylmuramate dehydrogenase